MSIHKNYVEIIGNLGEAPELKMSQQNQPRLTFDVCTNKAYKEGDEWKSKSTWLKCTVWGNLATTLNRMNFTKGERVQIEGELRNNNWVNTQNGEKHNDIYIQVSEMRKMAKPQKTDGQDNSAAPQSSNRASNSASSFNQQTDKMYQQQMAQSGSEEDDGLPF